jgi:putative molybdenum carrier protein
MAVMSKRATVSRVVSGGQAGADRAALDVAIRLGIPYGGWCPRGGHAEDLPDPPGLLHDYPELVETPTTDASVRTEWNVRDSDATLLLTDRPNSLSGGSALTRDLAHRLERPVLVSSTGEAEAVRGWLRQLRDRSGRDLVLNVAGPRESKEPGLYDAASRLLQQVLAPPFDSAG